MERSQFSNKNEKGSDQSFSVSPVEEAEEGRSPERIEPEDIVVMIKHLLDAVEPMPSFSEPRLTQPGTKEVAEAINEIQTGRLAIINNYISDLFSLVRYDQKELYEAHKSGGAIFTEAYRRVMEAFWTTSENSLVSLWDRYSEIVIHMRALPNLTEEEKQEIIKSLYEAVRRAQEDKEKLYSATRDNLHDKMMQFLQSYVDIRRVDEVPSK